MLKHHLFRSCARGSSLSFRPCGFIYLVSYTLVCSAAAFSNVFTCPTQNINPTWIKNNSLLRCACARVPSPTNTSDFHPDFWDLRGGSVYQLRIIAQPVRQCLPQEASTRLGQSSNTMAFGAQWARILISTVGVNPLGQSWLVTLKVRDLNSVLFNLLPTPVITQGVIDVASCFLFPGS